MGNILAFVAIFILAMVVYPWVVHRFFPQPAAPAVAENDNKADKPREQKPLDAKRAEALQTRRAEAGGRAS